MMEPADGDAASTLLGPQRLTPTLPDVVRAAGSTSTPRRRTDGHDHRRVAGARGGRRDLVDALLGNTVNLRLHARAEDVFERDTELAAAHGERGRRLRDLQTPLRVRLAHAMDAVYELARRPDRGTNARRARSVRARRRARPRRAPARAQRRGRRRVRRALAAGRARRRRRASRRGGDDARRGVRPRDRRRARAALLNRLHLLGVADHVAGMHVFAWSAGAMVVTERIVVFHDDPPHGRPTPRCSSTGSAGSPAWSRCRTPAAACSSTTRCESGCSPAVSPRRCASASTTEPTSSPRSAASTTPERGDHAFDVVAACCTCRADGSVDELAA